MKKIKNIEVILVYTNFYDDWDDIPYSHLILQQALKEVGVKISLFSWTFHRKEIDKKILEKDTLQVWGIGSYINYMDQIRAFIKPILEQKLDNKFVVLGGFVNDNKKFHQIVLEDSGAHALNYGHADPFIKFVENLKIKETFDSLTLIEEAKSSGLVVVGQDLSYSRGKFPKLKKMPLRIINAKSNKDLLVFETPHYFECPNRCNYCNGFSSFVPNLGQSLIDSIVDYYVTKPNATIDVINFAGPTFEGSIVDAWYKLYDAISIRQENKPKGALVIDSKQIRSKNYEETIGHLKKLNVELIYVGLNTVDGNVSEMIGRNNSDGSFRTQRQLDDEMAGVLKLFSSDFPWLDDQSVIRCRLDLMLTPFETKDSIKKMIDFYSSILDIQKKTGRNIEVALSPLVPYPGTKLFNKYQDLINFCGLEVFGSYIDYDRNTWKTTYDGDSFYGAELLRSFYKPYIVSHIGDIIKDDPYGGQYTSFEALNMTVQYMDGIKNFEDMKLLYPEFKNSEPILFLFRALNENEDIFDLIHHIQSSYKWNS